MTKRQEEIMIYICEYNQENKAFPTYKEVGDKFNITRATAYECIQHIVKKNYLMKKGNKLRFTDKGYKYMIQMDLDKNI